ncbi:MAG TPA: DUF4215 domain-containing protein [Kofleriaceae bacterium]
MLATCVVALAACAGQDDTKICSYNGQTYLCPGTMQCATTQVLCVAPASCGNGITDPGEACDDGNTRDGDGCSSDCKSKEVCGNGIVDNRFDDIAKNEICDDGNTADGDGCSHDCKSREVCGNGIMDKGEVCDDGVNDHKGGVTPPKDKDGCNKDCTSTEVCGNFQIDREVGEVCDDGPLGSDKCSTNCRSNLMCNNFALDPGEECDHGLFGDNNPTGNDNHNDCRKDCVINRCGDGHIDMQAGPHHEDCDDAPAVAPNSAEAHPTETAACNIDCSFARCGDGKINRSANEQCDDSNVLDNDGCSHDCKIEFCGNGKVDNGEPCDFSVDPVTCNLDCTVSACGDGKLNRSALLPEQCDDHNVSPNDGCSPLCQFERCGNGVVDAQEECDGLAGLQPCAADCHQERCGNGILDHDPARSVDEQCDDHNLADGDGCSHDCKLEFCGDGIVNNGEACDRARTPATCNLDCTVSACGDGKLNPSASPPEQCDDGNLASGDGCSTTCTLEHCGNGVIDALEQCDGLAGLQPCSATCRQEICGNGILDNDPGHAIAEQCDDGNLVDGDGCSAACTFEFCGDGIVNNGEACDRAKTPATCNLDCTVSACGDGKLNTSAIPPEQCDDHNTTPGDGCSATCTLERCGNGVLDAQEECDGAVGLQPCSATCRQEICGNGILDRDPGHAIAEQCDDGNTIDGDGCSATCKFELCGDGIVNNGEACDRAETPATCNLDCTLSSCGDGKLNTSAVPPEQCDDHNTVSGDGCSATCTLEHCGNGVVDALEDCDGIAGLQPCSATCHQEICGNGILDRDPGHAISEQCDDGNTTDGDGCSATCKFESCGDGIVNNHEDCDRALTPATCNLDCTLSTCGDGKMNASAIPAEQCDDHNTTSGDGCSATCTLEHCGNGVVDALEDCDGIAGLQPCSATCHQERCGNGILDNDPGNGIAEECDDGNELNGDGCSAACTFEFCGDGIVNNREACDRNDTPATCNLDCTLSICGDGKLNASAIPAEECDDRNTVSGDGCSETCTLEHCGNGVRDAFEDCDGTAGLQPCSASCHQEICGNGILDIDPAHAIAEECDDGNTTDGDGCSATCTFEFCGDGVVGRGEACDRAATPATCNLDCTLSICGDGKANPFAVPPEQCDDHNLTNGDGCSATCTFEASSPVAPVNRSFLR